MRLIINADDFGLSKSITDGIIDGIKDGYITSTTLMVNTPYTEYAINKAIDNNINCIGLHFNLTVGKPIRNNDNLVDENGNFLYRWEQIKNNKMTYDDVAKELEAQIEIINKISEGKIKIDHIDTHHFLLENDIVRKVVVDFAKKMNIPVRREKGISFNCTDMFYEDFSLKNVELDNLKKMISSYGEQDITMELMVHTGYIDEYTEKITSYLEREKEIEILKEAKKNGLFDGIKLISFSEIL